MKKSLRILTVMIMIFVFAATSVSAQNAFIGISFSDVPVGSVYYAPVHALGSQGIITGYDDGTFKPESPITRTEATTMLVRTMGSDISSAPTSTYSDVPDGHWGRKYIMTATRAGILNGMGDGTFRPEDNVTYAQILKMVVCVYGKQAEAFSQGGWPKGYIETAFNHDIISEYEYYDLMDGQMNEAAPRGDVARYIYAILPDKNPENGITVGGTFYYIGMPASELSKADEVLESHNYNWYVYDTATYKNFFALGIDDSNKVVAIASSGSGFEYCGYRSGSTISESSSATYNLYTDKNDGNKVHAVMISGGGFMESDMNASELAGESKMNFHFTNAFRVYHGKSILKWSDKAAKAARLHSEDMANKDYFSHDSLDGTEFSTRMQRQGISWYRIGENISAGRSTGIENYNGWVNSSGHRNNMLGSFTYLGVGAAVNYKSTYGYYCTQDFYS